VCHIFSSAIHLQLPATRAAANFKRIRLPLSILIHAPLPFQPGPLVKPLAAAAATTSAANPLASRITQIRLLTDLYISVGGLPHGVFPPTHLSVVRTPCFRIQVHWPGKCPHFEPSPALLCYHALPHIFIHGQIEHQPKFGDKGIFATEIPLESEFSFYGVPSHPIRPSLLYVPHLN